MTIKTMNFENKIIGLIKNFYENLQVAKKKHTQNNLDLNLETGSR